MWSGKRAATTAARRTRRTVDAFELSHNRSGPSRTGSRIQRRLFRYCGSYSQIPQLWCKACRLYGSYPVESACRDIVEMRKPRCDFVLFGRARAGTCAAHGIDVIQWLGNADRNFVAWRATPALILSITASGKFRGRLAATLPSVSEADSTRRVMRSQRSRPPPRVAKSCQWRVWISCKR